MSTAAVALSSSSAIVVAYDIGKAVNPMLVEGQIAGGVAQGIGGALFEEFLYDARGEPLSVNFADYLMPTAREIPPVEVLITEDAPSPLNPLGLKGAGEGGVNPAGAAIAAAIDDALGMPGAVKELPVTPQRLEMLRGGGGGRRREGAERGARRGGGGGGGRGGERGRGEEGGGEGPRRRGGRARRRRRGAGGGGGLGGRAREGREGARGRRERARREGEGRPPMMTYPAIQCGNGTENHGDGREREAPSDRPAAAPGTRVPTIRTAAREAGETRDMEWALSGHPLPGGPFFRFLRYDVTLEKQWLADEIDVHLTEPDVRRLRSIDDPPSSAEFTNWRGSRRKSRSRRTTGCNGQGGRTPPSRALVKGADSPAKPICSSPPRRRWS